MQQRIETLSRLEPRGAGAAFPEFESAYGAAATRQKVRWYQTVLRVAGGFADLAVNGNHNDPETRSALRRFQRFYRLKESGYLEVDSNVALTQLALEWIYRTSLPNRKGTLGDSYGALLRRFQADYGLTPDGQVGPLTREKMIQVMQLALPSPLRRFHRTLGPETPTAAPAANAACALAGSADCPTNMATGRPSSLIGRDDRAAVKRILQAPWRWICLVRARYDDPDGGDAMWFRGTGVLIGSQHVLTAAHLLLDEIDGSKKTRRKREAREIQVVPACGGWVASSARVSLPTTQLENQVTLVTPFGLHRATGNPLFEAPIDWLAVRDFRHDYAVFRLERPIGSLKVPGSKHERLGWWGRTGSSRVPVNKENLLGQTVFHAGYPGCRPDLRTTYREFFSHGKVSDIHLTNPAGPAPEWFGHEADSRHGQSGGPIWTYANRNRNLVGIQSQASRLATVPGSCWNVGIHLSSAVWAEIDAWVRGE